MFGRPRRSMVSLSNIGACRARNSALWATTSMRPLRTKADDLSSWAASQNGATAGYPVLRRRGGLPRMA
jgi:hypothetical protein